MTTDKIATALFIAAFVYIAWLTFNVTVHWPRARWLGERRWLSIRTVRLRAARLLGVAIVVKQERLGCIDGSATMPGCAQETWINPITMLPAAVTGWECLRHRPPA